MAVRVQHEDFDVGAEVRRLTGGRTDIGAVVTFTGTVRGNDGPGVASLTLEHYPGMTEDELARVEADAAERWPLMASLVVHRVGTLRPGDNIVLVVTASSHRQAAFAAAEFLMDYLKTRAPFWKKELAPDGTGAWVDARESDDRAAGRWEDAAGGGADSGALRRFDVGLLIVHPKLTPAAISAALALEARTAHQVEDRRKTPKGTPLPGVYRATRWLYSVRHETQAQHFAVKVADLVDMLEPHRAFFEELTATGGDATLLVQFLGDDHFGDSLPPRLLARIGALHMHLAIESFGVAQSCGRGSPGAPGRTRPGRCTCCARGRRQR
jgi:molybdopterin synthase catalytic subunit